MARKKHLINIHTSTGTSAPSGASLYLGEIAVQHTPDNPAMWIKMGTSESSDVYEKFIGETEILNIVNGSNVLGSAYTYDGIPYVNSSTTIADAYSALTKELIDDERTISAAFNTLNDRITEVSGAIPDVSFVSSLSAAVVTNKTNINNLSGGVVANINGLSASVVTNSSNIDSLSAVVSANSAIIQLLSAGLIDDELAIAASLNDLNNRVEELSAASPDLSIVTELSASVISLSAAVEDNEFVVAAALNNLDGRISEVSGWAADVSLIQVLSAGLIDDELAIAASLNDLNNRIDNVLPSYTASDNGKVLMIVSGAPSWVTPTVVYSGSNNPNSQLGNDGDIYLQI